MLEVLRCTGESMAGTFDSGDLLLVVPFAEPPQVGDIVVFAEEGADTLVAHRIHSLPRPGWLITRGDALAHPDEAPVPFARVRGRVVGSFALQRRATPGLRRLRRVGTVLLGPLYRAASGRSWLRARLRAALGVRLERLTLRGPGGRSLVHVIHGERTVAWLDPGSRGMRVRFPYRLLVDPP